MNNREYLYEVVISGSPAGITGIQAANMVELIDDAGKVVWRRAEQVPGLSAIEGNPAVAGLLDTLNVQAITALDARTQERDAAVLAKQTAESQRDTALARVQQLEAQLAAPAVRFIKKWQLRAGMRKDDPSGRAPCRFRLRHRGTSSGGARPVRRIDGHRRRLALRLACQGRADVAHRCADRVDVRPVSKDNAGRRACNGADMRTALKFKRGATFSYGGLVALPDGSTWDADCKLRDLNENVIQDMTVTLTPPVAPETRHALLIEATSTQSAAWPLGALKGDVRFFDSADPPVVIVTSSFALNVAEMESR
jgi:hypothetical protein